MGPEQQTALPEQNTVSFVREQMNKQEFNQNFWKYKGYIKALPKKEKSDVLINTVGDCVGWVPVLLAVLLFGALLSSYIWEFIQDPKNFLPNLYKRMHPKKTD